MDLNRYLELYLAESQDHLRALGQGLLALESGNAPLAAVEEAFRAAHTIKGMSATMGFRLVTDICHQLEDRLDDVRARRLVPSREVVDALLARADELASAIQTAVDNPLRGAEQADATRVTFTAPSGAGLPDADTPLALRVLFRPDSPLKAARAMIIVRTLQQKNAILSHRPEQFSDEFAGVLLLTLAPAPERERIIEQLRNDSDVASVVVEQEEPEAAQPEPDDKPRQKAARLVRVDQNRLDQLASGIGELTVLQGRLADLSATPGPLGSVMQRFNLLVNELRESVLSMRMVPAGDIFDRFPRVVRDAARALGKDVELRLEGREIELDRRVLDEIVDPLVHLLRNAVDHGIEGPIGRIEAEKPPRGTITLRALRERSSVRIELEDDGRGVNLERVLEKARQAGLATPAQPDEITSDELLRLLSHPGFSTAEQVTDVSGRGVGLDAVLNRVRVLGGAIDLATQPGRGSTFTIRLPVTLAVAQALRVRVADEDYAIPLTHVSEAVSLEAGIFRDARGRELLRLRDDYLPLIRLSRVLGSPQAGRERAAVVAEAGERRSALAVDELVGREQILVKEFDGAVGTLPLFSGVTLLADGRPALVLDPLSVV